MADAAISALPAATTPLAGTEEIPVVQGGETRRVALNDLPASPAVPFAMVRCQADGTIEQSYNVDSVDTNPPGGYTINFTTEADAVPNVMVTAFANTGFTMSGKVNQLLTTSVTISFNNEDSDLTNSAFMLLAFEYP